MNTDLYIVKFPKPYDGCTCYVNMCVSAVHERKDDKVLIDAPATFVGGTREKVWVPASYLGEKV